ncbi:hypothetical protein [Pseudarthrobacter sp. Y6]|uniref:hypothetical protein n=1 Tax=Pseudarthrobacter sp. Y6 TaxID=3418422 RepID=UPI003CF9CA86
MHVSVKTAQFHLTRIYAKFHVTSRSGVPAAYPGGREQVGVDGGVDGGKSGKQTPPQ